MVKKHGLGKGLGALILENEDSSEEKVSSVQNILIDMIKANVSQPRKYFDEDKILELSESIKNHGLIQPLILRKNGETYEIIAGERRWRAARLAGLKEIPVIIMEATDKELLELSLIENIQRQDLNPIEEASAYRKLLDEFEFTQEELSIRLSKSRTSLTNCMRLLNLDERVQQYIIEGIIFEGHGRAILPIQEKDLQYEIAQKVIDDSLSVRETEKLVKNYINHADEDENSKNNSKIQSNPYLLDIKDRLQNYFGTKVEFNQGRKRGKLVIEYYSNDDLQRILDLINAE